MGVDEATDAADVCAFCGDVPVHGTSTYDSGEVGPACAACCDAPSPREGETDLAFAERIADALAARGHEWGADVQTALFVAVREVRRLRAVNGCANAQADLFADRAQAAQAKLARVEAYVENDDRWHAADGRLFLRGRRDELRALLRSGS